MRLQLEQVTWSVEARKIVNAVSLEAAAGEFIGLIGPNGSGKSSLLKTIYRVLKPDAGLITLDNANVWQLSVRDAARRTAVVTQEHPGEFDFTVKEFVGLGRNPHKALLDRDTAEDEYIIQAALQRVRLQGFEQRSFQTLSGGEKQRVLVARALTQQTKFLILDEPTNHLDIRYQLEILDLIKSLGVTTIAALHDLNLAALYCDRLFLLNSGQVVASGQPAEVLTPALIEAIYGIRAEVERRSSTGQLHIIYMALRNEN